MQIRKSSSAETNRLPCTYAVVDCENKWFGVLGPGKAACQSSNVANSAASAVFTGRHLCHGPQRCLCLPPDNREGGARGGSDGCGGGSGAQQRWWAEREERREEEEEDAVTMRFRFLVYAAIPFYMIETHTSLTM